MPRVGERELLQSQRFYTTSTLSNLPQLSVMTNSHASDFYTNSKSMHSSLPLAAERLFPSKIFSLYPSRRPCSSRPCRSRGGGGAQGGGMFLTSGMWGPAFAAGRGHIGARITPVVETPGRSRHGEPRPAPPSRFGFSGCGALPRAGNGRGNWGPPPSRCSRHEAREGEGNQNP